MYNSPWYYWPWFTLTVFFVLVKWLFGITRGQIIFPWGGAPAEGRHSSDGILFLLVLALVVGVALCVLIEKYL